MTMETEQIWKIVKKRGVGRPPLFSSPQEMWEQACEYFEWCDNNPWYENKVGFYEGVATHTMVAKARPYTIQGVRLYLSMSDDAWLEYKKRSEFIGVIKAIEEIIYKQKFEGASAGFFNSNIIARDLGLSEKTELNANVKNEHTVLTEQANLFGNLLNGLAERVKDDKPSDE